MKPQELQGLTVKRRSERGTRPASRLRLAGVVPGVVYGKETSPMAVAVSARELTKCLRATRGEHALIRLTIEGPTTWEHAVLVKEVQHHPVDGGILHVGFHAILLTERIRVKIPIVLKGDAVGVKQGGGVLEHFLREVEVECLPTEIPAQVESDISLLTIGDTVHVRDLMAPPTVRITTDPEGVIASVLKPKEERAEEAPAITEPEVLREKKPEEAAASGEAAAGESAAPKKEKA
jgi:large subunit ribosomal protein L25